MPAPQTPVTTPVTFSFNSGEIQLTSVIDPETKQHLVTCDLCSQVIKLGIRGSIIRISQHRDSEISLYFSNLNIPCSNCGNMFRASAQPLSQDRTGGLISRKALIVHAPWVWGQLARQSCPVIDHAR